MRAFGVRHFFSVDVEEYFHVTAFEDVVGRHAWDTMPRRLDRSVPLLLDALHRAGATATFFVLGWVAEREPEIVRSIAAAGHEIASHGYSHRRVWTMTPGEFRDDLRASRHAIECASGTTVVGYRAPSFSFVPGCEWAFDVLIEEGFTYDSSIFPIRRRGYGYPNMPRDPYVITRAAGTLTEFPLATASIAGFRIPAAGGGYLRQLPFPLIRRAFIECDDRGAPGTFYIHPWELDPAQPRLNVDWLTRVRHYRGLRQTGERIDALLSEFSFTSMRSYLRMPTLMPASAAAE
jgi:polysaccharide deacetylase family protein (PEP-CTERM system associated)